MNFLDLKDKVLGKIYIKQKDVYFKYSSSEQWTGKYWIDGKKIYVVHIELQSKASGSVSYTPANVNEIIDASNLKIYSNTNSTGYVIPFYESSAVQTKVQFANKKTLTIVTGSNQYYGNGTIRGLIYYTKTTG